MAVINLTPDSFYEGSRFSADTAVEAAVRAVNSGAAILDLGAQSTAPGNSPITEEEELERLCEALCRIRQNVDVPISVDTFNFSVAKAALENGADIINDVSGKVSLRMTDLALKFNAGHIVMHTGGFSSAQTGTYSNGVIADINSFFSSAKASADSAGLSASHLCFDPGIGFGKTREDDLEIIRHFSKLDASGCAKLCALSRKRVTRLCGDALTGTVTANTACMLQGADIIRVHDVEQAVAAAEMVSLIKGEKQGG